MEIKSVMNTTYCSLISLLLFSAAFSQAKPNFVSLKNQVTPTLSNTEKADTILVHSIEMLKTTWENRPNPHSINLMPKNFNWVSDARRIESYKNMASQPKQDRNGLELPMDVHTEVIQNVYFKSPTYH